MPKLPVLSGADVIKALERLGFEQLRQRGSLWSCGAAALERLCRFTAK